MGKTVTELFNWKNLQKMNRIGSRYMFLKTFNPGWSAPIAMYVLLILGPDTRRAFTVLLLLLIKIVGKWDKSMT